MLHNITVLRFIDYCNTVILLYFIFTNLMYTLLMVLSLYSVSLYSKFASHQSYEEIADSPATPPVSLIVPAYNEAQSIVQTVLALMSLNYPEKEIIVVDDGSTDDTINVLVREFGLLRMDFIYRESIPAKPPLAYYFNPDRPELIVMYKENGGKSDALNVGINMVHSPYFCTVDADSIIEADALLRLMAPVLQSSTNVVASGGVVRIANGCTLSNGRITKIDLPKKWLERCQVVEYIRTFLFGRPGWNLLNATFIASGALMVLHTESVTLAGGYSSNTVTEDIEMIATLHRFLRARGWKYRMVFTTEPICWTEAPHTVRMLARQRRRWQLGLMQTVMKHNDMIVNPTYGPVGMLSMPFHAYMEAMGCLIEAAGTILVPVSFIIGIMPIWLFLLILFLAIGYGTLLSVGSVLLEETTIRRYPRMRHTLILMFYAVIENFGYKQMVTFFRAHAILQYFFGKRTWEHVVHRGLEPRVVVEDYET